MTLKPSWYLVWILSSVQYLVTFVLTLAVGWDNCLGHGFETVITSSFIESKTGSKQKPTWLKTGWCDDVSWDRMVKWLSLEILFVAWEVLGMEPKNPLVIGWSPYHKIIEFVKKKQQQQKTNKQKQQKIKARYKVNKICGKNCWYLHIRAPSWCSPSVNCYIYQRLQRHNWYKKCCSPP